MIKRRLTILLLDKRDFKIKVIIRGKEDKKVNVLGRDNYRFICIF